MAIEVKAPRVEKKPNYETAVVLSDTQFPFQDDDALKLVDIFLKETQPDRIFLNGDIADCWALSRYPKEPDRIANAFRDEMLMVRAWLESLRKTCPKAKITFIAGNHCYRLKSYLVNKAPELFGFLTLDKILDLKSLDIEWIDSGLRESFVRYGKILIGHFDVVRAHSAYTAKALVDKYNMSIVQGHTHRQGMYFKTTANEKLVGIEQGALCNAGEYQLMPNWQKGFCVIKKDRKSDHFNAQLVQIINKKMFYGDKIYTIK